MFINYFVKTNHVKFIISNKDTHYRSRELIFRGIRNFFKRMKNKKKGCLVFYGCMINKSYIIFLLINITHNLCY